MKKSVTAGLVLGVLVVLWNAIVMGAGLFRDPSTAWVFWLVVPINIGVIIWGLRQTRFDKGYGGQVLNGLVIGVVGAIVIVIGAYVLMTAVFPGYLDEVRVMQEEILAQQATTPEQRQVQQQALDFAMQPWLQALMGGIGTIVTSLITALIAAVWLKKPV